MIDYFGEPLNLGDDVVWATISRLMRGTIYTGMATGRITSMKGSLVEITLPNNTTIKKQGTSVVKLNP